MIIKDITHERGGFLYLNKHLFAIIIELFDGFFNVAHCQVGLFFLIGGEIGVPPLHQLLDGAYINHAVVQITFKTRHVF